LQRALVVAWGVLGAWRALEARGGASLRFVRYDIAYTVKLCDGRPGERAREIEIEIELIETEREWIVRDASGE